MQTITTDFHYRNHYFTIILDNGYYLAINHAYLTNGRLNRQLNGFDMYADKELSGCISKLMNRLDYDYFIRRGLSKAEAISRTVGVPLEAAKMLVAMYE